MRIWPSLVLLLYSLSGSAVAQQEPADGADDEAAESSRRVDESEESFRARMELREQRFREQQRSNTTFSYSSGREDKLANLPPASQEHIRAQLRDMIIDSRVWKPGEDVTDYPYEPSPAAQGDPDLARREREAWVEQLQKYQEREAAAWNASGGGTSGKGQGQATIGSAATAGAADGAAKTAAGSEAGGGVPQQVQAAGAADRAASAEAPPAGVTESALDFLQQRGFAASGAGAADDQGADAGEQPSPSNGDDGSESVEEPGQPSNDAAAAPPGTVAIADLQRIEFAVAPDGAAQAAQSQSSATITLRDRPPREPEPGTIAIEALQELDPRVLGVQPEPEPAREE